MHALAKTERTAGAMEIVDRDRPEAGPGEAVIEIDHAGLCGSDAGIYEFEAAFDRMDLPTVLGHEYAGRVVEVGEGVDLSVGDRVVERPIRGCGDCYQCSSGSPNVCRDAAITGVDHDGAYEPYLAVPADALHPIPDGVDRRIAATAEPTSVGVRAVAHNSRVSAGDRVLVEGPGPIGLLTAQVAAAQGGTVVVSGVGRDAAYRLPLAEDLGFEAIDVAETDLEARTDAITGGRGFDVVFDTTGHPSGLTSAVDAVRKGGQIVLVGQTGTTEMPYSPLVRGEVDLQCSYASTYEEFDRAFRLFESGAVDPEPLIDERFSLTDADEAFETFLAGETCKPLFDVSELRD